MIKLLKALILVLSCFFDLFSGTVDNKLVFEKITGKYNLVIENDLHHGYGNYIEIAAVEKSVISGNIAIDWNIGPEARLPMDYEKMYVLPFKARLKDEKFRFTVEVAKEYKNVSLSYEFFLRLIRDRNFYRIEGLVFIKGIYNKKIEPLKLNVAAFIPE